MHKKRFTPVCFLRNGVLTHRSLAPYHVIKPMTSTLRTIRIDVPSSTLRRNKWLKPLSRCYMKSIMTIIYIKSDYDTYMYLQSVFQQHYFGPAFRSNKSKHEKFSSVSIKSKAVKHKTIVLPLLALISNKLQKPKFRIFDHFDNIIVTFLQ